MSDALLLKVEDLHVHFGASRVLHGISLSAGLSRLPSSAATAWASRRSARRSWASSLPPAAASGSPAPSSPSRRSYRIARDGIGYVPQGPRVFPSLTVDEHLKPVAKPDGEWDIERSYDTFPRLAERRRNGGDPLSGGEQQMLALAPPSGRISSIADHCAECSGGHGGFHTRRLWKLGETKSLLSTMAAMFHGCGTQACSGRVPR